MDENATSWISHGSEVVNGGGGVVGIVLGRGWWRELDGRFWL